MRILFLNKFSQNILSKPQLKQYFLMDKPLKLHVLTAQSEVSAPAGCEGTVNILFRLARTGTKKSEHIGSQDVAYWCVVTLDTSFILYVHT